MMSRFNFKHSKGFSLVELMVVLAIMGIAMSLTGGLVVSSVNKHERVVELERVKQIFNKLSYNAFYTGRHIHVSLSENRLIVRSDDGGVIETSYFSTLQFVASDYLVSNRALVVPSEFSVINMDSIRTIKIPSVYGQYENK